MVSNEELIKKMNEFIEKIIKEEYIVKNLNELLKKIKW